MSLLANNLTDFMNKMDISRAELAELSGVEESSIADLEQGTVNYKVLGKICAANDIDYTSLFDKTGFRTASLEIQYDSYPPSLKEMISSKIISYLVTKVYKSKNAVKELILDISKKDIYSSRVVSRNSILESSYFKGIEKALSIKKPFINFREMLAGWMFARIRNHNFSTARNALGISISSVASMVPGWSNSSVGNWSGPACTSMPVDGAIQFASLISVDQNIFCTKILDTGYFVKFATLNVQKMIPDEPSDVRPSVKPSGYPKKKVLIHKEDEVAYNTVEYELADPIDHSKEEQNNDITVPLTDELLLKMFKSLSEEDKTEIKRLIASKFFGNL